MGLKYNQKFALEHGQVEATAGMEYEQMEEDRLGYINNLGKQGALKRDETGSVSSTA